MSLDRYISVGAGGSKSLGRRFEATRPTIFLLTNSRRPQSSQSEIHARLNEVVDKHCVKPWRQPIRSHSKQAFEAIQERARAADRIVLDSGCGIGQSTANLARVHSDSLVLGVDKSLHRLNKSPALPENALLVRADLADFWRLALADGWRLEAHYLFYPNPWPKPGHLQRRWHAHPVFPSLLALGGRLELRSNFKIYVDEFIQALDVAGCHGLSVANTSAAEVVSFRPKFPISPFEQKYLASGHDLFKLTVDLENNK